VKAGAKPRKIKKRDYTFSILLHACIHEHAKTEGVRTPPPAIFWE
jgi:hypothetical protein